MYLLIERDEHRWLVELIERRIRELQSKTRRNRLLEHAEAQAQEQETLHGFLHRLHECECDVLA